MARWKDKDEKKLDRLEKVGKMRKRGKPRTTPPSDQNEEFEKPEDEWVVGGEDGAFAARVVEVHKRYCFVSSEEKLGKIKTNDVWLATIARKHLQTDRDERNFVAVGDRVLVAPAVGRQLDAGSVDLPQCVIQHISPRTAKIARNDPHHPAMKHVLAANMDQLMIVASYLGPTVKWGLIDRYLVLAESEGIPSIIVLNKKDLLDGADGAFVREAHEMFEIYKSLGYETYSIQSTAKFAAQDDDIRAIGRLMRGKVTLLSGHSGVGKSSLINLFDPELEQVVEENSDIFYKGRHTTTFASFIRLGKGGYVIDTPGIRSFTFDEKGPIELSHCFVEMRPYLGHCKYRECRHMEEPECVIRQMVEEGKITRWRYKSYLGILLGATGREGRIRDLPLDE